MAHKVTIRANGTAEAMYAGKPAWHNLGTVVENAPTSEAAIRLAQLDWTVEQMPLIALPAGSGGRIDVPPRVAVANVRTDNDTILGVVTDAYNVVQNVDAFSFMDAISEHGYVRYEAAGSLRGGRFVWLLARLADDIEVGDGDIQRKYLLFLNSHDGKTAVRVLPTAVRVVCWNTLQVALRDGSGLWISHRGNLDEKIQQARNVLTEAGMHFDQYASLAQKLAMQGVQHTRAVEYFQALMPDISRTSELGQPLLPDISAAQRRARLMSYYESDPGHTAGTAWGLVNAATAYSDHGRNIRATEGRVTKAERRFESAMIDGGTATFKALAMKLACAMFLA